MKQIEHAVTELEVRLDIYQVNRELAEAEGLAEDAANYSDLIVGIEKALVVLRAIVKANSI